MLKKILLGVRYTGEEPIDTIFRPLLWGVKPNLGEEFFISRKYDTCLEVKKIQHYPVGGVIEVFFDTDDVKLIELLLKEEDGEWIDTANFDYDELRWLPPDDRNQNCLHL